MKKEKRKDFEDIIDALDFIDDLAKRKPKVTGYLHAPTEKVPWSVTYKLPEKENNG